MNQFYTLRREQVIQKPLNEVFAFFQQPENLARITPASMDFRVLTPSPIIMKENALLDYSIRLSLFRLRWTTMITSYQPPISFVDIQLRGPYSFWHHTHSFKETDDGTLMTDEVRYSIPFGFLGNILHALYIKKELQHIFDFRAKVIEEYFHKNKFTYSNSQNNL